MTKLKPLRKAKEETELPEIKEEVGEMETEDNEETSNYQYNISELIAQHAEAANMHLEAIFKLSKYK